MTTITIPAIPAVLTASALLPATTNLSVRLLHLGVLPAEALKPSHGLLIHPSPLGRMYYNATAQEPPDWAEFLERGAPGIKPLLHSQHSSAVLLLEAGPATARRLFAFCFGQGHHAIEHDFIERQFGMRVVLNSVSRKDLRVLDSASLESTVMQRRTQASRDSDLKDFGLDTNRELLRLASGTPSDRNIAKAVSGKDALQIRKKLAFADLPALCDQLLDLFSAVDYKTDFGFIDQIKPVHKGTLTDTLDALLLIELIRMMAGTPSELHLAVPDILPAGPSSQLSYHGARMPRTKSLFDTLAIEDYITELNAGGFATGCDIDEIRTHLVCSRSNDPAAPSGQMKVYDCMVFETQHNNKQYVLFDGQWYEVSDVYYQDIQRYYLNLKKTPFLTVSSAANEQAMIVELCDAAYPHLLCIDRTKINPAGVNYANLEVCDFVSHSKQLIHLKDSASSAPLSHLFNQGLVSAEALRRDSTVRTKFRRVADQRETEFSRNGFVGLLPTATRILPAEWTVVFGVLKKKGVRSGTLDLPFFSKVSLRAAADRISLMGYQVELHLIEKR